MDKRQRTLISELSRKYDLSERQVIEITNSPFEFIRSTISNIKFNGDETEEEFNNKAKNFNIPRIGKMYSLYSNFKKINDAKLKKRRSVE